MSRVKGEKRSEILPPDPSATIESLGALGYSPESAIADLVDNSISAGATSVKIQMTWDGPDSWCAVTDDGVGMTEDELRQAMRIGSTDPLNIRANSDLGKFGFGLKTASLSQARELTVVSRTMANGPVNVRCWDVARVRKSGLWTVLMEAPDGVDGIVDRTLGSAVGTAVIWRGLGRSILVEAEDQYFGSAERHFLSLIESIDHHMGVTFNRFLSRTSGGIRICVNGCPTMAWDPFLPDHPATQIRPEETLMLRSHEVIVRPFVLPHKSKLSFGEYERCGMPSGWTSLQGFYVFRGDRLIHGGGWLNLRLPLDDDHNLARISIDVPSALDHDWSLEVTKASVTPPAPLKRDLLRIAEQTRKVAIAVYRHRGGAVGRRVATKNLQPMWTQSQKHGEVKFRINRSHPVVRDVLREAGPFSLVVSQLLSLVENTVPIPMLPGGANSVESDALLKGYEESLLEDVARRVFSRFLEAGQSLADAKQALANTEPFNEFPELVERVASLQ